MDELEFRKIWINNDFTLFIVNTREGEVINDSSRGLRVGIGQVKINCEELYVPRYSNDSSRGVPSGIGRVRSIVSEL